MLRCALRIIPVLPRPILLSLAKGMGHAAYCGAAHLRRVGLANLDLAYDQTLSKKEKKRILKHSFRSFALVILDTLWFSKHTHERIKKLVRLDRKAYEELLQPRAQICVTAHLGNWEILGMAFSLEGYPLASVAAPLANPAVDQLFNTLRNLTGQHVYSKHGVVRQLLKTLRENGKVGFVLDQNTKPTQGGIFVNFFGLPVPVSSAAALLSQHTGADIYVGSCLAQKDGTYVAPPPVKIDLSRWQNQDRELALHNITQAISNEIEKIVRTTPEQWLWMYKRWKYVAPEQPREKYPFYAKSIG